MPMDTREAGLEKVIGTLLRIGVVTAGVVVLAGGIWYLSSGRHAMSFSTFQSEPRSLRNVAEIVTGIFSGDGRSLIQMGMLILIATPVARVIISLVAFAVQRDRLYVVVTAIVLLTLLFSLSGG